MACMSSATLCTICGTLPCQALQPCTPASAARGRSPASSSPRCSSSRRYCRPFSPDWPPAPATLTLLTRPHKSTARARARSVSRAAQAAAAGRRRGCTCKGDGQQRACGDKQVGDLHATRQSAKDTVILSGPRASLPAAAAAGQLAQARAVCWWRAPPLRAWWLAKIGLHSQTGRAASRRLSGVLGSRPAHQRAERGVRMQRRARQAVHAPCRWWAVAAQPVLEPAPAPARGAGGRRARWALQVGRWAGVAFVQAGAAWCSRRRPCACEQLSGAGRGGGQPISRGPAAWQRQPAGWPAPLGSGAPRLLAWWMRCPRRSASGCGGCGGSSPVRGEGTPGRTRRWRTTSSRARSSARRASA